ncbi:MAG: hypothetical protein AB1728_12385, partial [Bacteroidota bacterium]
MRHKYTAVTFIAMVVMLHPQLYAYDGFSPEFFWNYVLGETMSEVSRGISKIDPGVKHFVFTSKKSVRVETEQHSKFKQGFEVRAPLETAIESAYLKSDDPDILIVLFSNGTVKVFSYRFSPSAGEYRFELSRETKIKSSSDYPYFKQVVGDALYVLEGNGIIHASWDTAKTWSVDTSGLHGVYPNALAVDTNRYGWVATSNGVFYQHPDSNIWHRSETSPAYCLSIFVDRKNRIFVSSGGKVYVSTNSGMSWVEMSDGIFAGVSSFGDDAYGNVYAVTNTEAFRLSNFTLPWEKISDSIASFSALKASSGLVNSISGDSVLYAATKYGLFESKNAGSSWKYSAQQFSVFQFYGVTQGGNYFFASTNLGVFRVKIGDTVFTKVLPATGYQENIRLKSDSAKNIYAVASVQVSGAVTKVLNFKSTDLGITWVADTAGLGSNPFLNYYGVGIFYEVDAQGNQYTSHPGAGLFSKSPGGMWKLDTNGLNLDMIGSINAVSNNNKKGVVYAVKDIGFLEFALYKRALNGSMWEKVDITPVGQSTVKITNDQNGDIVLTTFEGKIFRYNGATWSEIPKPTTIGSFPIVERLIVDRNGVLWGSFYDGGSYIYRGVHFTTDNGTTWKYVGLDSVGVNFLATAGDSVYAVTFIDGIYKFTTSSVLRADNKQSHSLPASFTLYQNYPNPFNPTTN